MKRLLFVSLLLVSCTVRKEKLAGTWQAVAYYEAGQSIQTPLEEVQLSFSPAGDYSFKSIGYYEEKGAYRVTGRFLFLTDTTVHEPLERALKIQYLSDDTLKIGMEADGNKRAVFFCKKS